MAWPSKTSWRYDLTAVEDATEVTLMMTKKQPKLRRSWRSNGWLGFTTAREHLRTGMSQTLTRLAQQVERATPHHTGTTRRSQ